MVRVDDSASTQGVEVAEEITEPLNLFNGLYLVLMETKEADRKHRKSGKEHKKTQSVL